MPTPPSESVAFATSSRGPVDFRFVARDRPIGDGELVVLSPGALYAGYEADVGTTVLVGSDRTARCRPAGRAVPERPRRPPPRMPSGSDRRRPLPRLGADRRGPASGRPGARPRPRRGTARDRARPGPWRAVRRGLGPVRPVLGQRGGHRRLPRARHRADRHGRPRASDQESSLRHLGRWPRADTGSAGFRPGALRALEAVEPPGSVGSGIIQVVADP